LISFISQFRINENKWIRLRTSNEKTTLAVKQILAPKEGTELQQVKETEMVVPSREVANDFLEAIGLSHRGYLEKKRTTYILNNHKIEIDTWPKIPTYFELEGKDEKDIEEILNLLGYSMKDKNVVSCIVDEVYEMYGYPKTTCFKELKF
jgi:adenylate cyclase class 2